MGQVPAEGEKAPDFELLGRRRQTCPAGETSPDASSSSTSIRRTIRPAAPSRRLSSTRLRAEFAKAGADILGVSPDSVASHAKFRKKYDLALPLASDEGKDTLNAYGVWVQKSMYGRKYMGVERTTFLIKDGRIARVGAKFRPGHAEEVLAAAAKAYRTRATTIR